MARLVAVWQITIFGAALIGLNFGFPELSMQLHFQAVPELEEMFQQFLLQNSDVKKRRLAQKDDENLGQQKLNKKQKSPIGKTEKIPLLLGTAQLVFFIEFQRDYLVEEAENGEEEVMAESIQVDQPLPKLAAQYDYFGPTGRMGGGNFGGFGGNNPFGSMGGDTVNFDFQCKCQAKSALARTLNTPLSSDPNQAAQQQIQQLQEQVRKLQEQINRSQQGKSSFEQFAQMLAMSDGLDCSCSGQSTPWMGWPSGAVGGGGVTNPFGGRISGGPLSQAGMGGGGQFPGQFPMGGLPMGSRGMGGGGQFPMNQFGGGGQLYPGYPLVGRHA